MQEAELAGTLNCRQTLSAAMSLPRASLEGTVCAEAQLQGRIFGESEMTASVNVVTKTDAELYEGSYESTPSTQDQVLDVGRKVMARDVVVKAIPYYETSNETGTTVYIGG